MTWCVLDSGTDGCLGLGGEASGSGFHGAQGGGSRKEKEQKRGRHDRTSPLCTGTAPATHLRGSQGTGTL